jgi:hypothetical protein
VPSLTSDEALARARAALELEPSLHGDAWPVQRVDQTGGYFLVVFGRPEAAVAVAAVDSETGELLSSARLAGIGPHFAVTAQEAVRRAGMSPEESAARLVWRPSRQSRSPLYPLWEVREAGHTIYVDQQGATWPRLDAGGPGGGEPSQGG